MNLEYFIVKRLIASKKYKSSISAPIIKIAVSAIAMGIIMMLIAVSTGMGLKYKIRDKISAFSGHIVLTNYDSDTSEITVIPLNDSLSNSPFIANNKEIKEIHPFATKAGIIRTEDSFEGIVYKGVDSLYNFNELEEYLIEGTTPKLGEGMSNEILLSEHIANRLHLNVGDRMTTYFMKEWGDKVPFVRQFEIVGIFSSGLQQFDSSIVLGDLKHVQRLNRWSADEIGGLEVVLNNFDNIQKVGAQLYSDLPTTVDTKTIIDKYISIFGWLDLFDFNIFIIIGIMIIVASVNIVVALLVLILERTQMIGILKALGANNWTIRKIFVYNAVYLIFKGLVYGNVIGLGLLFAQKYFGIVQLDPVSYYVKEAPVLIRFSDVLLLNLGVVIITAVVLVVPSYLITKISPTKAIKYD